MNTFAVTLNYNCNYGFVEYNEATKTATVTLPVEVAKLAVEKFLATPLTLDIPQGETIRDFVTKTLEHPLQKFIWEEMKPLLKRIGLNVIDASH